jgi:hypothetical protein
MLPYRVLRVNIRFRLHMPVVLKPEVAAMAPQGTDGH